MNNHKINKHKKIVLLFIMVYTYTSYSQQELYINHNVGTASRAVSLGAVTGLGYLAYKAVRCLSHRILGWQLDNLSGQQWVADFQNGPIRDKTALVLGGLAGGITGLLVLKKARQWLTPGLYMHWSRQTLLPKIANNILVELDCYLMHLSILNSIDREFNELIKNLNSQKYHQSASPERLKILDGAFYHLKEYNLIAELEKEQNFHMTELRHHIYNVGSFIAPYSKDYAVFNQIKLNYEKFVLETRNCSRDEALAYMQDHETQTIYEALSEFYTHIKLFTKGFNEGINIIDEACKINILAQRLLDKLSANLQEQHDKVEGLLEQGTRLHYLEKLVLTQKERQAIVVRKSRS